MASVYALLAGTILFIVLVVVLAIFVLPGSLKLPVGGFNITTTAPYNYTNGNGTTVYSTTLNQSYATSTVQGSNLTQLDYYMLSLINRDRSQYGLANVTLSAEPSAQQHSQSMYDNQYFSHWDIYGMKPYMRYTALGGTGAVSENIATNYSTICIGPLCHGNINVTSSLAGMEYDMMYNDQACCNNGHRENILDPNHNQVSIGVSYDAGRVYLTQDFVDDYISWSNGPAYSAGEVTLPGQLQNGYSVQSVEVAYDQPIVNMSVAQLNATSEYGYGDTVAGVVSDSSYYYDNITTIVADRYQTGGSGFNIQFNMQNLVSQYGPGEYTLLIWLNQTGGNSFLGSTYTIFIGSNGQAYAQTNV
ncbi:MAG TPA: CAP domain-containing protein [Candidatus Baltobacteraceae bacterium]|nr:CAP domain-containing protein [Candidatus Baltobacteraceae bacterium]